MGSKIAIVGTGAVGGVDRRSEVRAAALRVWAQR